MSSGAKIARSVVPVPLAIAIGLAIVLTQPGAASANLSYSHWIHQLTAQDQDVEVVFNLFEDASWNELTDGVPFPDLSDSYSLIRYGEDGAEVLFEDLVLDPEDAVEVTPYQCQYKDAPQDQTQQYCENDPDSCEDCDNDGTAECYWFCAVAYRFVLVDECVPPGETFYSVRSSALAEHLGEDSPGGQSIWVADTGDQCLDGDDSGCSVSGVGAGSGAGLALFMLGIGLLAVTLSRRKR